MPNQIQNSIVEQIVKGLIEQAPKGLKPVLELFLNEAIKVLDVFYLKIRHNATVINMGLPMACEITSEGNPEILGSSVSLSGARLRSYSWARPLALKKCFNLTK